MAGRPLAFICLWTLASVVVRETAGQEGVPQFPAGAEIITVDAVVLDGRGRPVRGLSQADFTILEGGKPQEIVAFEVRDLEASRPADAAAAVGLPDANDESPTPGRTLAFILDDTGQDARCVAAIDGIRKWVRETADPRDNLTLATTSGDVSFEGTLGSERGTILRELDRIRCRRPQPSFFMIPASDHVFTEWEAYEAVSKGEGNPALQMIVGWWRDRARTIVSAIETFSREHADRRGRKAVFVFTQGFIQDRDLKLTDQAIDTAQRANTALYFVDPRGLIAGGVVFPDSVLEATHGIDLAGADEMARETGGATLRNSDLAGSLRQAIDESAAYYLLGYAPSRAADGTWRKVEVRVDRQDSKVRARRGYYASAEALSDRRLRAAKAKPVPAAPVAQQGEPRAAVTATLQPNSGPGAPSASQHLLTTPSATAAGPVSPEKPAASAQSIPEFSTLAEAITVDVVVLDKSGKPVSGLSQADFSLFEDGRPQPIIGFAPRSLAPREEEAETETKGARVASNEGRGGSEGRRRLAFVVDDLGIEPSRMAPATKALSDWLAKGADPRDEVTLVTSSGDAWWSDTVGAGREDLEALLRRMIGKKRFASTFEAMSDWESYTIDTRESPSPASSGSMQASGPPSMAGGCVSNSAQGTLLDRVVDRWFGTGACVCDPMSTGSSIARCRTQARQRATEIHANAKRRAQMLLSTVERMSRGMGPTKGRKSILILSEGFLRDTDQGSFERAVDASRRGNTSVSFVDVRGLVALPLYGADQSAPPSPGVVGMMTAIMQADIAGGEYLAETTGGVLSRDTNDLAGAVTRLAAESSAYYLLGYQTERPLDGKWRKLQVKVSRPGIKVRARRGYFATAAQPLLVVDAERTKEKKGKKERDGLPVRALDPALFAGGGRDEIPLRILPHVFEANEAGQVRVLVAVEVQTEHLTFVGAGKERTAKLDVTVLGVSRDQSALVPLDSRVELSIDQATVGGWWVFARELRLPAGPAQVRALVRDAVSGRSGLVVQRVEIPSTAAPYLSTPILTTVASRTPTGQPTLVAVAHRTFPPRGYLYCAYEVYAAPGRELSVVPDVRAAYSLSNDSGRVVASSPPTQIGIALGAQIVRLHQIPLGGLAPGRYELSVHATDGKQGLDLSTTESFLIEARGDQP